MSEEPTRLSYTYDYLLDRCYPTLDQKPIEIQNAFETEFNTAIERLVGLELLSWTRNQFGEDVYTPVNSEHNIDSLTELEKTILYCLTLNKSIFNSIILHCQFDKSNQSGLFIIESIKKVINSTVTGELPVIFMISDNLQGLLDQTKDGLNNLLCDKLGIESGNYTGLFSLKSDEKTSYDMIANYMDSYSMSYYMNFPEKKLPPIILSLPNPIQIKKVLRLHKQKVLDIMDIRPDWPLRSVFIFDEMDRTYRGLRNSFRPYIIDSTRGVSSVLGVTGTEDGLSEEFPEWGNSTLVSIEVNPEKQQNYRSINHTEAKIRHVKQESKETNIEYALRIIRANLPHFTNPRVNPRNGKIYFPKSIILGNLRVSSHSSLANSLKEHRIHSILQNGNGLKIRRYDGGDWISKSTTKKVLRDVLFKIFNEYNLWDAPVALIGFKKIDRGVGYHYAPPSGGPGLIWTDEIMGHIDGDATSVQRVSRAHGVIAQCEDYPNEVWFWVDPRTDITVRNTNNIITSLHKSYRGFHPLKERLTYAKQNTDIIPEPDDNGAIGETEAFESYEAAKAFIERFKRNARVRERESYFNTATQRYDTSLTAGLRPFTIEEYEIANANFKESSLLNKEDLLSANGFSCRLMPLYSDDTFTDVVWCVRWASTRFECGEGLTKEDVLIRKYSYIITYSDTGEPIIRVERSG